MITQGCRYVCCGGSLGLPIIGGILLQGGQGGMQDHQSAYRICHVVLAWPVLKVEVIFLQLLRPPDLPQVEVWLCLEVRVEIMISHNSEWMRGTLQVAVPLCQSIHHSQELLVCDSIPGLCIR